MIYYFISGLMEKLFYNIGPVSRQIQPSKSFGRNDMSRTNLFHLFFNLWDIVHRIYFGSLLHLFKNPAAEPFIVF